MMEEKINLKPLKDKISESSYSISFDNDNNYSLWNVSCYEDGRGISERTRDKR